MVVIECAAGDTEIIVYNETTTCGKLIVKKNNSVIAKKVIVVQLRDNLPVNSLTLGEQNANVNIVSDISKFLSHANIEPIYETPYIVINTNGNAAFQALKLDDTAPYDVINPSLSTSHNDNLQFPFRIKMNDTSSVAAYITTAFKSYVEGLVPPKKVEDYKNHLILVFTDREATLNADGITTTPAFRYGNFLFITKKTADYDIAHEFLHGFEIDHTFENNSFYTYMHGVYGSILNNTLICSNNSNDITDNVMDYFISPKKSTYVWQWGIMRNSVKKIK